MLFFKKNNHASIYKYIRPRKDLLVLILMVISTILCGLVPAVFSILLGKVFDILQKLARNDFSSKHELKKQLVLRSMAIMITGFGAIPLTWCEISSWMFIGERQALRVRQKFLNMYLLKPLSWYDDNENLSGEFIQTNRCVEEFRSSSAESSALLFQNTVTMIALVCTSFYYSWELTLVILASAPLAALLSFIFTRKIEKYIALENSETTNAASILSWCMDAAQLVRIFGTESYEIQRFSDKVKKCKTFFIRVALYTAGNMAMLRLVSLLIFVQGFWFGNSMIRKNKLQVKDVISCFSACVMLSSTLNNILNKLILIQKGRVAITNIEKLFDHKKYDDIKPLSNNVQVEHSVEASKVSTFPNYRIDFENVSFRYPSRPNELVLSNISLNFMQNQITFIVGKSGSGKSTLCNLLLRFYDNYTGSIKINSKNIYEFESSWLLKNITLVEQSCTLFNDTLRNNIMIAASENIKNSQSLKKACRIALLEKLLLDFPDGLDTVVGSSGISLSGGQKQRVAIARAIVRDTPILILDEFVSALDNIHRDLLMEAIRVWRKGKTTIILTHELSYILNDDYLYLMEDGKVAECGLKGSLIQDHNSKFYHLYNIQNNTADDCASSGFKFEKTSLYNSDKESIDSIEDARSNSRSSSAILDSNYGIFDKKILSFVVSSSHTIGFQNEKYTNSKRRHNKREKVSDLESQPISIGKSTTDKKPKPEREKLMPLLKVLKLAFSTINLKYFLFLGIILSILTGVSSPGASYTISKLLNGILPQEDGTGSSSYILRWSLITVGVSIADALILFLKNFILSVCSELWIMNLRTKAMNKICEQSLYWFSIDMNKSSEISALVLNDLRDLRTLVSGFLSSVTTLLCVSLVGITWAIVTGWKLSLVCLSLFPSLALLTCIYGGILRKLEDQYKSAVADLENAVSEMVEGIKTIKCLQLEDHFVKKFMSLKSDLRTVAKKRSIVVGCGIGLYIFLIFAIQSILCYYGIKLVIDGEYSRNKMFQTFTLLLFTIISCASLISEIPELSRGQRAATYIFRVLNEKMKYIQSKDARTSPIEQIPKDPIIKAIDLNFSYPSAENVKIYHKFNVDISANKTVAIVGESGSGKSTFALLLSGLYSVPEGSLFIDGTDICKWDLNALRKNFALVEQKPRFFDGTLIQNLLYGITHTVSEVEITEVLNLVGISEFVKSLPEGLNSRIDTRLISGGQAQRFSIARALFRRPRILILDECTSALDAENSRIIAELVKNSLKGVTTLVITHSDQMMSVCDEIIVLKNGHVVEQGKFDELMKKNGELHKIISKGEE